MHFAHVEFSTQLAQADLDTADLQTIVRFLKRDEERIVIICAALQVLLEVNFCSRIKVYLALFVAFTENDTLAAFKVNIAFV